MLCALALACGPSIDRHLADAQALQDTGQYAQSVEPLRAILAEQPDHLEANYLLGAALVQTGQPSAAIWPLQKAADQELADHKTRAAMLLATALLQTQSYDDAIRSLGRVLEIDPDRVPALRIRVEANLTASHPEEAVQDAERVVALQPDDYSAAVMRAASYAAAGRLDDAEKEYLRAKELGVKSGDATQGARGWLALASFYRNQRKDERRAEAEFSACLAAYPTDPVGLQLASDFFDKIGQPERATALWKQAVAQAPENLGFHFSLAERMRRAGDEAGAVALLRQTAESFGQAGAWKALADFQRRGGDVAGAEQSLAKGLEVAGSGPDSGLLRFAQADLLVDLGQLDRAEQAASQLEDEGQRDLVQGRILLARGDASGALARFDSAVRRWPNNAAARYFAGVAALQVGDLQRAQSEFAEALRADPRATDAALALAQIALDTGQAPQAVQLARAYQETRDPQRPEALRILARAQADSGDVPGALATLRELASLPGQTAVAIVERAQIESRSSGPAAAARVIEASRLDLADPANEPALRMLAESLLAAGQRDAATARVDSALAKHPESAALHALRGSVMARLGRAGDARTEFEKALALAPGDGRALAGLGSLALWQGDLPGALEKLDAAAKALPNDMGPVYGAAQALLAMGRRDDARARLEKVVQHDPRQAAARNDLAWLLADSGQDLDRALALAEQAHRLDPRPEFTDTLGWVRLKRKELDPAVAAFEEATKGKPGDPTLIYHLGLALAQRGDHDRALTLLRQALGAGSFPEADAAREEVARLESR